MAKTAISGGTARPRPDRDRGSATFVGRWFSLVTALTLAGALALVWLADRVFALGDPALSLLLAVAVFAPIAALHLLGLRRGLGQWKPSCWHPRRHPTDRPRT